MLLVDYRIVDIFLDYEGGREVSFYTLEKLHRFGLGPEIADGNLEERILVAAVCGDSRITRKEYPLRAFGSASGILLIVEIDSDSVAAHALAGVAGNMVPQPFGYSLGLVDTDFAAGLVEYVEYRFSDEGRIHGGSLPEHQRVDGYITFLILAVDGCADKNRYYRK